ncbi:MAG: putative sugar O-methyltransferase [Candidatus Hinthialibacter antarcticus]|nr:putative sugar O-methyltransferase [Candidatus Hinthialibacter antarcticus]
MDKACQIAKEFYEKMSKIPYPSGLEPSELWMGVLKTLHIPTINTSQTASQVCDLVTKKDYYSFPTLNTHHLAGSIIDSYVEWFAQNDAPLSSFDITIQESPYTSPEVMMQYQGRNVSTAFMWHLGMAYRIQTKLPKCNSYLEIGSGYGGLARIVKLLQPDVTYYMLDMDISLYFSYVFVSTNFPEAKCLLVDDAEKINQIDESYDFIFIPTQFIDKLKGLRFDVLVNTQSLSEMTQFAYDRFMDFMQEEIQVRYFYNANRYGPHPDGVNLKGRCNDGIGHDGCVCASALDPHWRVLFWELYSDYNLTNLDPRFMMILEIIVERIPKALRNKDYYAVISKQLFNKAQQRMKFDNLTHYYLWDSIRYCPTPENLTYYIQYLEIKGFQQAEHYKRVLGQVRTQNNE